MSQTEDMTAEVTTVIEPRERDLGDGFLVRRLLPAGKQRTVGPFVFFDHFGPTRLAPGTGMDVRPHPHINLATVTYLFEGAILHRDSLGSVQEIRPGDVNWMTAGRGIVHSERTGPDLRASGSQSHGLQLWVGLPRADEETAPAFHHHPAATLPEFEVGSATVRLLAGDAFGRRSPVRTFSPLTYLDLALPAGASVQLPAGMGQRGLYVVSGRVTCGGVGHEPHRMLLLAADRPVRLTADAPVRAVLIGGAPFPEPRHIWWNFVSSRAERIEQAKRDWLTRRGEVGSPFPLVPGDETEFIPLPES
jgi:redox-sensitive bicupin YhaK (pirin superfamily)